MIVAQARARWSGGSCTECRVPIPLGAVIYKVPVEDGKTTQHGQGPGRWVCARCGQDKFLPEEPQQDEEQQQWILNG